MAIVDLDAFLLQVAKNIPSPLPPPFGGPAQIVFSNELTVVTTRATDLGITDIVPTQTIALGTATLHNDSGQQQNMLSQGFSKKIVDSVTTTVTEGFKAGTSATAKFGVPLVGETAVTISFEVNFSESTAQTKTQEDLYTSPSQSVVVPAYSTRYVDFSLQRANLKGRVTMDCELSGPVSVCFGTPRPGGDIPCLFYSYDLYDLLIRYRGTIPFPAGFSLNTTTRRLRFNGSSDYIVSGGTSYIVRISESPNILNTEPYNHETGLGSYQVDGNNHVIDNPDMCHPIHNKFNPCNIYYYNPIEEADPAISSTQSSTEGNHFEKMVKKSLHELCENYRSSEQRQSPGISYQEQTDTVQNGCSCRVHHPERYNENNY